MLDHTAVFDDFDNPTYESLRALRGVVDCDESIGPFGFGGGHLELSSFSPLCFWWIVLRRMTIPLWVSKGREWGIQIDWRLIPVCLGFVSYVKVGHPAVFGTVVVW